MNERELNPEEVIYKLLQCKYYFGTFKDGLVEPHESQNIEQFEDGETMVVFSVKEFNQLLQKEYTY